MLITNLAQCLSPKNRRLTDKKSTATRAILLKSIIGQDKRLEKRLTYHKPRTGAGIGAGATGGALG